MKKLLITLLLVCMIIPMAAADDLSSLTYDQLIALRDQINAEIVSRPEWKEVEVPLGQWKVGTDIPAGTYRIYAPKQALINVWKKAPKDYSNDGMLINQIIPAGTEFGRLVLEEGWIFTTTKPVIFSPPASLGF